MKSWPLSVLTGIQAFEVFFFSSSGYSFSSIFAMSRLWSRSPLASRSEAPFQSLFRYMSRSSLGAASCLGRSSNTTSFSSTRNPGHHEQHRKYVRHPPLTLLEDMLKRQLRMRVDVEGLGEGARHSEAKTISHADHGMIDGYKYAAFVRTTV